MVRYACLSLAVVLGLGAAVLVATSPTVHYRGVSHSCSSVIVEDEAGAAGTDRGAVAPDAVEQQVARACSETQHDWSVLAGLAALLCVATGSVGLLSRRDPAQTGLSPG